MYTMHRGFTILELIISMLIISVIAGSIVPSLLERPQQARLLSAQQDVRSISIALDLYFLDNNIFPSDEQGIMALVSKPTTSPIPNNWHRYLLKYPKDPWGRPYYYQNQNNKNYMLCSFGTDGIKGGEAVDICNH